MTSPAPAPAGTPSGVVVTALLGLGAGMLLLAAVPGIARDGEGTPGSVVLLAAVGLLGAAALGWSLASMRAGALLARRAVVGLAFATTTLGVTAYTVAQPVLLGVVPGVRLPGADDYASAALLLLTAFGVVLVSRRLRAGGEPPGETAPPRPVRAGVRLLALAAGAGVVGALVTPGLAASVAGEYAVPHGTHGSAAADVPALEVGAPADYLDPARSDRPDVVQRHGAH